MRILTPRIHGVLDYMLAASFGLAPFLFAFNDSIVEEVLCFAVAGTILVLSLLTRYPLGLLRLIPFPVHGAVEFIASLGLIGLPWLAGFSEDPLARNFFIVNGVLLFAVWLVTDYRGAELQAPSTLDTSAERGRSGSANVHMR